MDKKPSNTHQHLAFVFSGKGYNQHTFPGQMTLQSSRVFVGSGYNQQCWKHDTLVDTLIFAPFPAQCYYGLLPLFVISATDSIRLRSIVVPK